jgi:hypothetical protein
MRKAYRTRNEEEQKAQQVKAEIELKIFQNELSEAYCKLMATEEGKLVLMHLLTVSGFLRKSPFVEGNSRMCFNAGLAAREVQLEADLEEADLEAYFDMRRWYKNRLESKSKRDD